MINDKMISEGRQVAGLENAVDQAREGEDGWVKDQPDSVDHMANAKLECQECGKIFSKSTPTADTKCPGCGGYDIDLANSKSDKIMKIDDSILNKYGHRSGVDLLKHEEEFIKDVQSAGISKITQEEADELEDQNYHTALEILTKRGFLSKAKMGNCTHCLGNGILPLVGTPCPVCNAPKEECAICSGTGYLHDKKCPNCSGTGLENAPKVNLDLYEQREFDRMTANGMSEAKALEILINTVEGDWSQLSTGLKRYAKSIGRSEGS